MKTLAQRSQDLIRRPQVALHNRIFNRLQDLRRREDGGVTIEYTAIVVVVGGIALALIGMKQGWADAIKNKINTIITDVTK